MRDDRIYRRGIWLIPLIIVPMILAGWAFPRGFSHELRRSTAGSTSESGRRHDRRTLSADEAQSDVDFFARRLERVHPDPYSSFGGKVQFKRRVDELRRRVPKSGTSRDELRTLLAGFLADMGDGHSFIERLAGSSAGAKARYLPLVLQASSDGIFVADATAKYENLLGREIVKVGTRKIGGLLHDVQEIFPKENLAGRRNFLARNLVSLESLLEIMPDAGTRLNLSLRSADGSVRSETVPYEMTSEERFRAAWTRGVLAAKTREEGLFSSTFVTGGTIAVFHFRSIWSREAFELMRSAGRTDTDEWVNRIYSRYLKKIRPEDLDAAISGIPSLIEETRLLLSEMKEKSVHRLIVDLRDNDGGWSEILKPFLFLLFGDRYLDTPDPVFYASMVSEERLAMSGETLDDLSKREGRKLGLGEYTFDISATPHQSLDHFISDLEKEGVAEGRLLRDRRAPDSLSVVVVTNGRTFSAAFDLTYQLWRFGAKLLGVSPSQAPVSFVDPVPFTLPNSRLEGAISRTAVVHPEIPTENREILLDYPMSLARFREFGFDPDSEIQYAIEVLRRDGH